MSDGSAYPQPTQDLTNAPFLEAWRAGKLRVQRCLDCALTFFYPRPMCPRCWSQNLEWIETQGRGRIVSFSCIHRPVHDSFNDELPVVLAEISLLEGATLLARVVCEDAMEIRIGMDVALLSPPEAIRYPLPTFKPR